MDDNISIKESTLEVSSINALTTNVMNNQPTINIGLIGHVAHGKSTIVKALTGVKTAKHSSEMKRNITMKLGYANAKIYQCNRCPVPKCYKSFGSEITGGELKCKEEGCDEGKLHLIRHMSFVDCPGHEILMATMLSGVSVMDAAILVIAANEKCPQPQTEEHLAAIELTSLKKIIIIQTKIDLVSHKEAVESYKQIMDFIKGTKAEGSPIIPISAQIGFNMDVVCEQMVKHIPVPLCSSFLEPPRMFVIRSFDINKPGTEVNDLKGGVAGGSLTQGVFTLGDKVEVKPGIISQQTDGSFKCTTIYTEIKSLSSDTNNLQFSVPGGLIGVGTNIDPILCRADNLVGQLVGKVGTLPEVYVEIEICFFLLNKLLGVGEGENKKAKINRLRKGETLVLNVGSTNTKGLVKAVCKDLAIISLHCPVCCEVNEKIAISREFDRHWRLIGWGAVLCGTTVESEETDL